MTSAIVFAIIYGFACGGVVGVCLWMARQINASITRDQKFMDDLTVKMDRWAKEVMQADGFPFNAVLVDDVKSDDTPHEPIYPLTDLSHIVGANDDLSTV